MENSVKKQSLHLLDKKMLKSQIFTVVKLEQTKKNVKDTVTEHCGGKSCPSM